MSEIKNQPKKSSDNRSLLIVSGILTVIGGSMFAYLMFYTPTVMTHLEGVYE